MAQKPTLNAGRPSSSRPPQADIDAFIAKGREQPDEAPPKSERTLAEQPPHNPTFALRTAPPRVATKRLAMEVPIDLHAAMKSSCVARDVTMTEEVIAILRSVYTPDWTPDTPA